MNVTTQSRPLAGSATGVPVIPEGSTLPHGRPDGTGEARCRVQRTAPVAAFSAYTVSFSVAMITVDPTMSGWAYTAPSTFAVHAFRTPVGAGELTETPLRPAVRS